MISEFDLDCDPKRIKFVVRRYRRPQKFKWWSRKPLHLGSNCWLIFDAIAKKPGCRGWVAAFDFIDDEFRYRGLVYDEALPAGEVNELRNCASGLEVMSRKEFVDSVLLARAYELRATILSSPFALSCLALKHTPARGEPDGFSLQFSDRMYRCRKQPRNRDSRTQKERDPRFRIIATKAQQSLMSFTAEGKPGPAKRSRQKAWRGNITDITSVATAFFTEPLSLRELCQLLGASTQPQTITRRETIPITDAANRCLVNVKAIWECYERLRRFWSELNIRNTPMQWLFSGASIGKALLKETGLKAWLEQQPEFSPDILDKIMQTFYPGRADVRWMRTPVIGADVDIKSCFPTAMILADLQAFMISSGRETFDCTEQVRQRQRTFTRDCLRDPENIRRPFPKEIPIPYNSYAVIVKILADSDYLPVRYEKTDGNFGYVVTTITSKEPMWVTLADCDLSQIHTGKPVKVLEATGFKPFGPQPNLRPVTLAGKTIDVYRDSFVQQLVELRGEIKSKAAAAQSAKLLRVADMLKEVSVAMSYGVFAELNAEDLSRQVTRTMPDGEELIEQQEEIPGQLFDPLIATTVTALSRLWLGCLESLIEEYNLDYAFMHTDGAFIVKGNIIIPDLDKDGVSMGVKARPMTDNEFVCCVEEIQAWFKPLYPYRDRDNANAQFLKLEPENFDPVTGEWKPLYCFALGANSHALYNVADGVPVIRKFSEHTLGSVMPPYIGAQKASIPEPLSGVVKDPSKRWIYDVWYCILTNADWIDHKIVVSRYPTSTPEILRSFDLYNKDKPYSDQIRPWDTIQAYWGKGKDKGYWLAPASADLFNPPVVINRDTGEIRSLENMQFVTYFDMFCGQQAPHDEDMFRASEIADDRTFYEGPLLRPHFVEKGRRISIGKEMHKLVELETRNDPDGSRLTVRLERKCNDTSRHRKKQLGERNGIAVGQEFVELCNETYTDEFVLDLLRELCREMKQRGIANALGGRTTTRFQSTASRQNRYPLQSRDHRIGTTKRVYVR
jgi:hypothetical protein